MQWKEMATAHLSGKLLYAAVTVYKLELELLDGVEGNLQVVLSVGVLAFS
jgi:hypothetical protein